MRSICTARNSFKDGDMVLIVFDGSNRIGRVLRYVEEFDHLDIELLSAGKKHVHITFVQSLRHIYPDDSGHYGSGNVHLNQELPP